MQDEIDTAKFGGYTKCGWRRTNDDEDGEGHDDKQAFIFAIKTGAFRDNPTVKLFNTTRNGYELWSQPGFIVYLVKIVRVMYIKMAKQVDVMKDFQSVLTIIHTVII